MAKVKNLPSSARDTRRSLSREDPLEKEMATHSSILAWEITWTEEPGGPQSMRLQESYTTEHPTDSGMNSLEKK